MPSRDSSLRDTGCVCARAYDLGAMISFVRVCAPRTFASRVFRPLMSSWWRGDVSDSAPPLEPRTGKLTYLGILPPVYTPHPSAGGAAQARPFPLLGPSPCPAPYLCCAGWPATPAQRGWPCEAPHLRRTNWAERAGWRKPAGTRPGQCWARITCWPSFWSTAMVCTVGPNGRIGS